MKRFRIPVWAVFATLALVASNAEAMSLRQLNAVEKIRTQGVNYANYYLVGVVEGILEAHAQAVRDGASATICIEKRLEPSAARSLFDAELRRNKDVFEADIPVPLVMENALTTVYPCVH